MSTATAESEKSLDQFTWDDSESFFGIPSEENSKNVMDEVTEDDETEDEKVEKKTETPESKEEEEKKEKEDEDSLFTETVKKTETSEDDEDKDDEDVKFFTELSKEFSTKGIFQHVTLVENEAITEEKFFELHEQEVEGRVEEAIQDFVNELNDEDGKAFITFKRAGGKTSDFFKFYSAQSDDLNMDIEKEGGQDAILKKWYQIKEQLDDDDIEDKLDWLKESGKKKKYAEKYLQQMQAEQKAAKDQFLNDQIEQQKVREEASKTFVSGLKSTLETTESVGDFAFNKNDKKELLDYLVKPAVKLQSNHYLTQFQADLNKLIKGGKGDLLLLAKLVKSNFDTTDLVTKQTTKVVSQVKSNLSGNKPSRLQSTMASKKKSLTDYF